MSKTIVRYLAYLFYLGVLVLPILLLNHETASTRPLRDQLSSYLALIALNILLLEFLLSGRIRFLSQYLGLDWVLQTHQLFARVALGFLVIHPFIYSLPNHPNHSPGPATAEYLGMNGAGLISGIIGLICLIAILALALGRESAKMRYETWRFTHVLLAVLVSSLGLYHVLVIGFYIQQGTVQIYYLCLAALATLSLVWTYIFKPLTQRTSPYAITSIDNITPQQFLLRAKKLSGSLPKILPGQYLWLKYGSVKPYPENPFSIALVRTEEQDISLLIKAVGDFTKQLQKANVGERIYIDSLDHFQGIVSISGDDHSANRFGTAFIQNPGHVSWLRTYIDLGHILNADGNIIGDFDYGFVQVGKLFHITQASDKVIHAVDFDGICRHIQIGFSDGFHHIHERDSMRFEGCRIHIHLRSSWTRPLDALLAKVMTL